MKIKYEVIPKIYPATGLGSKWIVTQIMGDGSKPYQFGQIVTWSDRPHVVPTVKINPSIYMPRRAKLLGI